MPLANSLDPREDEQRHWNSTGAAMDFDAAKRNRNGRGHAWSRPCAGYWALLLGAIAVFADVAWADSMDDAATAQGFPVEQAEALDESAASASGESPEGPRPSVATQADLDEAVRKAEEAADEAWLAARAADERARAADRKYEQSGPYVGAAVAYAAENFDDSIIVKSSVAGAAFVGYRFRRWFAAELRYEGFDGFDLKSSLGRGEIDGYAITINGKLRPLEGPIQPVMGIGLGGMRLERESVLNGGAHFDASDSDFLFRVFGGIDLPVNDHLMVNLEGAYLVPTDDLSDLDIGMVSAGLTYVF
jgi:opacity protein-like surface antigen